MRNQVRQTVLFFFIYSIFVFSQGNGNVEPYSFAIQALKGQTATDVTLTFSTSNPSKYPIPAALKKLQIKIRNQAGEVAYIHNAKLLSLTGNVYKTSITGPNDHNTIEVQAHIKNKDEEVIVRKGSVTKYPDVKVESVTAPSSQKINLPFNVEVFLTEINLQNAATCNVSLFKGASLVATISNVAIAAGGNASAVFADLTHNAVGTQSYSVSVTNVIPGEYDNSNNFSSFSIEFTNPTPPVTQTYYWLNYGRNNNYDYNYTVTSPNTGQVLYQYDQTGDFENFDYGTYGYDGSYVNTGAPLSASYRITTDDNRTIQGSFADVQPYYNYYSYYTYYYAFDPVNFVHFQAYLQNGYFQSYIYRYRSNYVYMNSDIYGSYYYENLDPANSFINASSQLTVSLITTQDDKSWGGGATMSISAPIPYNYNYNGYYYDYYYGYVNYSYSYSYLNTYNYSWGVTDLNILPKSGTQNISAEVPSEFKLSQNYPNPFNPSTSISYQLPESGNVKLTVTDIQGQEVSVLVNEMKEAGYHNVSFNAAKLPSGIYFYSVQTDQFKSVKKMILNK